MQAISDLAEMRAKILEYNDALTNGSDDAMRAMFATFRGDFSHGAPADPFSAEYRAYQLALHAEITGKPYSPHNERTHFDIDEMTRRPFPYKTGSASTVGEHFMAIGFMLRLLDLPPGARIVEFGPGWGHTTMALALLGYNVTAVDIEPNFCEILRRRSASQGATVDVVEADFFFAERVTEPYDAAIFFESFHHCDDHLRLLAALHTAVKPQGRIILGSEPIVPGYREPWGVSMDGNALWAMANFGWLELGFSAEYFHQALARTGWAGVRHVSQDVPWASVWTIARAEPSVVADAQQLTTQPAAVLDREAQLEAELQSVYASTSWRLTAPIRALKRLARPTA
jgi:SAM-dependent methyltransferase